MALDHVLQGLEHLLSLKCFIFIGTAGTNTGGGKIEHEWGFVFHTDLTSCPGVSG